jgi:hypothetical protein
MEELLYVKQMPYFCNAKFIFVMVARVGEEMDGDWRVGKVVPPTHQIQPNPSPPCSVFPGAGGVGTQGVGKDAD